MIKILKILIIIICLIGIIYLLVLKTKYQKDTKSSSKEKIIKYFQDNNITSLEKGIKTKKLPKEIAKSPYLLMMIQDKTLTFKAGKYYLNK